MDHDTRQHLRFPPDEGGVAWIDPNPEADENTFKPIVAALVIDEALAGCGLVTLAQDWLNEGAQIKLKVEGLAPLTAEVRWIRPLGDQVVEFGVALLE